MNNPHSRARLLHLPAVLAVVVLLTASSQANCPSLDSAIGGWPQDSVVYYDVSSLPSGIQSQVIAAFNAWNTANVSNNSGVSFQASGSGHPPATCTFVNGSAGGNPAETSISHTGTVVTGATITIDANNTNFYDPNQSGYSNVFLKIALHEIGHTMGLNDEPVGSGNCARQFCS